MNTSSTLYCCAGSGGLPSPVNRSQILETYHSIDLSYRVFWTVYSSYREEAQNFNATIVQHNFIEAFRHEKNLEACRCHNEHPYCKLSKSVHCHASTLPENMPCMSDHVWCDAPKDMGELVFEDGHLSASSPNHRSLASRICRRLGHHCSGVGSPPVLIPPWYL